MGGNAAQRKKAAKRDAKMARQAQVAPGETWTPPPMEECVEDTFDAPMGEFLISSRNVYHHGRLVHYAIVLSRRTSGGTWEEAACVDCCHGSVHLHTGKNHIRRAEDIRPIRSQRDVESTYNESYDLVYDIYEAQRDGE